MEKNDARKYTRMVTKEFEETYGDLAEKARKIPSEKAEELAKKLDVPPEIAKIAIRLELDGVIDAESACKILMNEMERLKKLNFEVPNISSYLFNFAVKEGKWIEYLYKTFRKEAEESVRSLANWERIISDEKAISEGSIINFLNERKKIIDEVIEPVVNEWVKSHRDSSYLDAALTLICALEKIDKEKAMEILEERKNQLQQFLTNIYNKIKDVKGIKLFEHIKDRIATIIEDLSKPVADLMKDSYLELILNSVHRPVPREVQVSPYVFIGGPVTRGGKVEPDLVKPTDFLERDIRLARRRHGEDQAAFLTNSVAKVLKTLVEQGMEAEDAVIHVIKEIYSRFGVGEPPVSETEEKIKELIRKSGEDKIKVLSKFLFNHLMKKFVRTSLRE